MDPRDIYPSPAEVDEWCRTLLAAADGAGLRAETVEGEQYTYRLGVRHSAGNCYVRFEPEGGRPFFGFWQPVLGGGPAPLLVHLPGYGAEISAHPELVSEGYNVLHVSPLGFATPEGPDESLREGGEWPVLPETARSGGEHGYVDWLRDAVMATTWALGQPCVHEGRLAFFGTSQGGGGSLLLASILRSRAVKAVAADEPFLTGFALVSDKPEKGAYGPVLEAMAKLESKAPDAAAAGWRALGLVDTLSHAHRLTMPVLLTSGGADTTCPPDTIRALFERLPATRSLTELAGHGHGYTPTFLHLASAWFRAHV